VSRLDDRLDPGTYAGDPLVVIRGASRGGDGGVWISERVAWRLLDVGRGYDLHYLGQVIEIHGVTTLGPLQCQGVADELAFVRDLVNDPVLADVADRVAAEARSCASTGDSLVFDLEQ
jgi:hypothetical protein